MVQEVVKDEYKWLDALESAQNYYIRAKCL
jgi:hypothetical protein